MLDLTKKRCSRCKLHLPRRPDLWSKYARAVDGLQPYCKPCRRAYRRDNHAKVTQQWADYRAANREQILAKNAVYRETHKEQRAAYEKAYMTPERMAEKLQKQRDRVAAEPEKYRARRAEARKRQAKNRDAYNALYRAVYAKERAEYNRKYRQDRPWYPTLVFHRRRALKIAAFVEDCNKQDVWKRDGGICRLCGANADPETWEMDHLTPLARGGKHAMWNVAVACQSCNRRKHTKTYEEWIEMQNSEVI